MIIAIAGATGVVGAQASDYATSQGHTVQPLSRSHNVDLQTGAGLDLTGVDAVIDCSGPNTISAKQSKNFFVAVTNNLLSAAAASGVQHFVPLSIVGAATAPYGYYAGKALQEELVAAGSVPYTLVRATQFFEFAEQKVIKLGSLRLMPTVKAQPIAAATVGKFLVDTAIAEPINSAVDIAGVEQHSMVDVFNQIQARRGYTHKAKEFNLPGAFGRSLRDGSILPGDDAQLLGPTLDQWLNEHSW